MAEITVKKEIRYQLTLSEQEILYLINLTRNYLPGYTDVFDESFEDAEIRQELFTVLYDAHKETTK